MGEEAELIRALWEVMEKDGSGSGTFEKARDALGAVLKWQQKVYEEMSEDLGKAAGITTAKEVLDG